MENSITVSDDHNVINDKINPTSIDLSLHSNMPVLYNHLPPLCYIDSLSNDCKTLSISMPSVPLLSFPAKKNTKFDNSAKIDDHLTHHYFTSLNNIHYSKLVSRAIKERENVIVTTCTTTGSDLRSTSTNEDVDANGVTATVDCADNVSILTLSGDICRICHCEAQVPEAPLISPCHCVGTLRYVHRKCLLEWIKIGNSSGRCELCRYNFVSEIKIKPLLKWRKLKMSRMEQWKLALRLLFHMMFFIGSIVWLYGLILRIDLAVSSGQLHWSLWTQMVGTIFNCLGLIWFSYFSGKKYRQLFQQWRHCNTVTRILIQDLSKQQQLSSSSNNNNNNNANNKTSDHDIESGSGGGDDETDVMIAREVENLHTPMSTSLNVIAIVPIGDENLHTRTTTSMISLTKLHQRLES